MVRKRNNHAMERNTSTTPLLLEDHGGDEAGATTAATTGEPVTVEQVSAEGGDQDTSNRDNDAPPSSRLDAVSRLRHILSLMASPVTGQEGAANGVAGMLTLLTIGSVVGLILPKSTSLPTPWYRMVSSCIGYSYFIMWSISFYPQMLTNFRRKTTVGLSVDFCALNVIGFACYSAYNLALFYSTTIQEQYRHRHGGEDAKITVQSNDVAFAVHAFLLSLVTVLQIFYYDGVRNQRPTRVIGIAIVGILATVVGTPLVVLSGIGGLEWLDYLYVLSYIKICITLIKYVPQVVLNFQRKSTEGWSIWQILLDFSGGTLSDLQLVLDCMDLNDWTGITGNLAKFFLGLVSICFDSVFMLQHYVWYRDSTTVDRDAGPLFPEEETALV